MGLGDLEAVVGPTAVTVRLQMGKAGYFGVLAAQVSYVDCFVVRVVMVNPVVHSLSTAGLGLEESANENETVCGNVEEEGEEGEMAPPAQ